MLHGNTQLIYIGIEDSDIYNDIKNVILMGKIFNDDDEVTIK